MQKKLVTIVGARPQFIKAAMVSHHLKKVGAVKEILIHTGQHYDENMSSIFFEELEMSAPDHHLEIGSLSHGAQTGRMLEAIEKVLLETAPQGVLIYGDTNSTLAGALAASKLHIPIFHVEAGLRSFNMKMPEEINRIVSDGLSQLLFAPTKIAIQHLLNEGISEKKIHEVGDVMYDIALHYGEKARKNSQRLDDLNLTSKKYLLATIHRAENTDNIERLKIIFDAFIKLSKEIPVVLPLHPRTRGILKKNGLFERVEAHLNLIEPLGFLEMMLLEIHAKLIVTDSGGVQKEAFFHGVPCVTLRDETEWVELVELGWNHLIPPVDSSSIVSGVLDLLVSSPQGETGCYPYGRGDSSKKIVDIILNEEYIRH